MNLKKYILMIVVLLTYNTLSSKAYTQATGYSPMGGSYAPKVSYQVGSTQSAALYTTSAQTLHAIGASSSYSGQTFGSANPGSSATNMGTGSMYHASCSVAAIHNQVMDKYSAVGEIEGMDEEGRVIMRARPGGGAVGELTPIGDGVWLMLLALVAYAGVRYRKHARPEGYLGGARGCRRLR